MSDTHQAVGLRGEDLVHANELIAIHLLAALSLGPDSSHSL